MPITNSLNNLQNTLLNYAVFFFACVSSGVFCFFCSEKFSDVCRVKKSRCETRDKNHDDAFLFFFEIESTVVYAPELQCPSP